MARKERGDPSGSWRSLKNKRKLQLRFGRRVRWKACVRASKRYRQQQQQRRRRSAELSAESRADPETVDTIHYLRAATYREECDRPRLIFYFFSEKTTVFVRPLAPRLGGLDIKRESN